MWKSWNGNKAKKLTRQGVSKALGRAAEATFEVSQQQVPLDESTLQNIGSGVKKNPNNDLEWVIFYGGGEGTGDPKIPYAVKWHEVPANFQHGRKHNYLKDPVNNFAPRAIKSELQKEMRKAWS